jgi:Na+/serine symporter
MQSLPAVRRSQLLNLSLKEKKWKVSLVKMISQIVVVIVTIRPLGLLRSAAITLCIHGDRKLNLYVQKKKNVYAHMKKSIEPHEWFS